MALVFFQKRMALVDLLIYLFHQCLLHEERKEEICEENFHYTIINETKYKETSSYSIIMRIKITCALELAN
jgi:hypothetical protein